MKEVAGNIFDLAEAGKFDVIIHGCNCFNTMGAGIAKEVKRRYPLVYAEDLKTISGDKNKLGTLCIPGPIVCNTGHKFTIINAYTQYTFGPGVHVDYNAIRNCFRWVKRLYSGARIAYPKIGAGLGGGDWERISRMIDEELSGENHTLVVFG